MPLVKRPLPTGPEPAVPPAALDDPSPEARRAAARRLAADPAGAAALCARLEVETDPTVREVLFIALASLGSDAVVAGLLPLLRSEDPALRNGAIETLQQLPEQVAPHMRGLLSDPDSDVRIFAVNVVGSLQHPAGERWLLAVLRGEAHVNVIAAAVDTLAEIGTEEAVAPLEALPARFPGDAFLAFAVRTALRRIRGA